VLVLVLDYLLLLLLLSRFDDLNFLNALIDFFHYIMSSLLLFVVVGMYCYECDFIGDVSVGNMFDDNCDCAD